MAQHYLAQAGIIAVRRIKESVDGDLPNVYLLHGELSNDEIYELYNNKSIIPIDFYDVTHFHEVKVNPYWSKKLVKIGTHNQHVFYKGI